MTTAREIVEAALRKISAIGIGQSLPAEEADQALTALNTLIASWSAEGNMIYAETSETFNITANDGSYTIGTGADFNTSRPLVIQSAYVTLSGDDYPLDLVDFKEYALIGDKTQQGTPEELYYDAGFPTGTIKLWPYPNEAGTITLYSQKALTGFSTLNTSFAMPGEYERALIYNLGIEMAPEYEKEPSMTVMRIAHQSKEIVSTQNTRNDTNVSRVDGALQGQGAFNIYTGQYE